MWNVFPKGSVTPPRLIPTAAPLARALIVLSAARGAGDWRCRLEARQDRGRAQEDRKNAHCVSPVAEAEGKSCIPPMISVIL